METVNSQENWACYEEGIQWQTMEGQGGAWTAPMARSNLSIRVCANYSHNDRAGPGACIAPFKRRLSFGTCKFRFSRLGRLSIPMCVNMQHRESRLYYRAESKRVRGVRVCGSARVARG